jgi:Protein of unknown function (DUF1444)
MNSNFKNKFKKSDLDEINAFCQKVISILKEMFPSYDFVSDENGEVIKVDELKLGLTNLRSKFLLTSQTNYELKNLVEEHFGSIINILESNKATENKSWDAVQNSIMLQLMPVEFTSKLPMINFPLGDEVAIGIVIDGEKSYQYVTPENLENWGITKEELHQTAIENLMEKSANLQMTFVPPPNGLIVINTMDSFDAVRILAPQMQDFFADKLGNAFYFGIPNRDFLICWSKEGDEDFQKSLKTQLAVDFEERPYPLSKSVFEFDKNDGIKQLKDYEGKAENWVRNN